MPKQPTIYDVAREAGVSLATVSRVINDTGVVRAKTVKLVNDAIKRLNYHPNSVAKSLATSKTTSIALVIPTITDLYYAELAQGVDVVSKMYGFSVVTSLLDESDTGNYVDEVKDIFNKQIDGVIFLGEVDERFNKVASAKGIPVVFTGTVSNNLKNYQVSIDYKTAFEQAAEIFLKTLDEKQIALVVRKKDSLVAKKSEEGFLSKVPNAQVFEANNYAKGYELGAILLENKIKAAMVRNGEAAVGILNYLLDNGVLIPNDFQIITADDSMITHYTRPQMSSIFQPKFDLGAVSMRLLTKLIDGDKIDEKQIFLPHEFIMRGTTK